MHLGIQFSGTICWTDSSFPLNGRAPLLKNIWPYIWGILLGSLFCSVGPHYYASAILFWNCKSAGVLKLTSVTPPTLLFFFKTVSVIWGSLKFCMNFRIYISISEKNHLWDFDKDCTAFTDHFEVSSKNHLLFQFHEQERYLYLFRSSKFLSAMFLVFRVQGLGLIGYIYFQVFYYS